VIRLLMMMLVVLLLGRVRLCACCINIYDRLWFALLLPSFPPASLCAGLCA